MCKYHRNSLATWCTNTFGLQMDADKYKVIRRIKWWRLHACSFDREAGILPEDAMDVQVSGVFDPPPPD